MKSERIYIIKSGGGFCNEGPTDIDGRLEVEYWVDDNWVKYTMPQVIKYLTDKHTTDFKNTSNVDVISAGWVFHK